MMHANFAQILNSPADEKALGKLREALDLLNKTCQRMDELAEEYRREAEKLRRELDGADDP